jgi:prevent-host-death family protein
MQKVISAADANRNFSALLRGVREGKSYVVTSHGRPVARIEPVEAEATSDAKRKLLARLRSQPVLRAGQWKREELYDDDV